MNIKLIPVSHPELEEIEIEKDEFIIGRLEEPFISANSEVTADMSRRHAKIFRKNEQFFIVDLGSLNGTAANGIPVQSDERELADGDHIEFSKHLKFKVEISNPAQDATILSNFDEDIRLTLEPVDKHSGLDLLVITGFPFLVSKEAGVFASFQTKFGKELNRISRRHAYIFQEQGEVKLADMSSTNGTLINNEAIDNVPTVLKSGDVIAFGGGFFSYIVDLKISGKDINDATVISPSAPAVEDELVAIDVDATSINANVVPVAIDQAASANEQQAVPSAAEIREPVQDNTPSVEAAPEPVSEPESVEIYEPKTTYVNEPDIFLEILCEENINIPGSKEKFTPQDKVENKSSVNKHKKPRFTGKFFSFFGQLSAALKEDHKGQKTHTGHWRRNTLILLLLTSTGIIAYLYLFDPVRKIEELIKQKQYQTAATESMALLAGDPDANTYKHLATKAVLNLLIPDWLNELEYGNYPQAQQLVTASETKYAINPDIIKALQMMQWIGKLHQYMSIRNENRKIILINNILEISSLLNTWEQNKLDNELTLRMMARNVPEFEAFHNEATSDIRTLENDQDIYLSAIQKFESELRQNLQTERSDTLLEVISRFEDKYPKIKGLEDVKLDANLYIELNDALTAKDIERVAKLQQHLVFQTPIFKDYAEKTLAGRLPSDEFQMQYFAAKEAWKSGKIQTAVDLLLNLSGAQWGPAAVDTLNRYKNVLDKFNALNRSKGTPQYTETLFDFHAMLKMPDDGYYLSAIENDFQDNKKQAIAKVNENIATARKNWSQYKAKGGIGGMLRLENKVSRSYKIQAGYLSVAFGNIQYVYRLYNDLHMEIPLQVKKLHALIAKEVDTQTKWLKDLELLLPPALLREKLALINSREGEKNDIDG